jgi:hypothetical protein
MILSVATKAKAKTGSNLSYLERRSWIQGIFGL